MKRNFVRIICALLAICALCALCACSQQTKASNTKTLETMDPVEIRFAHALASGELMNNIIEDWMEAVTQRSNGKITFDYYPAAQLGTFSEINEQVNLGTVDMSGGEPSYYEEWCPEVAMLYAPMICDSYDHLGRCIYGKPGELIADSLLEKSDIHLLRWVYSGARVIASVKPLRTLADMEGLVIRSPNSQPYIDTFTLMGMTPKPMNMGDMYTAIEQGVVAACDCPAQALYEGGYHTITGNICKTRHMYALGALSANEKFWNSLPEDAREMMLEEWDKLEPAFNDSVQTSEDEYYVKFEAENTLVTEFTDSAAFREIAQPYWNEKAEAIGGNAPEILAAINELR